MRRALELARRGEGSVEPNPMVGAVLVDDDLCLVGEGWHEKYGGPHAEVNAIRTAGDAAAGATLFVTLEPCNHHGRTPPCSEAVIAAGIRRVYIATPDPAPHTNSAGVNRLRDSGLDLEVGLLKTEADALIAPFEKRMTHGLPWVHAKWAMTLDGRIASRTRHSQWISCEESRGVVHQLRGRMDAILIGRGTAEADDPLLTARPPGPRTPLRVVLDTSAALSPESQLVQTARDIPVLVFAAADANEQNCRGLEAAGVMVELIDPHTPQAVLRRLAERECTNVFVEGGSGVLGSFFDRALVDELHVFVAPKVVGGLEAIPPVGGEGLAEIPTVALLEHPEIRTTGSDIYIRGRCRRSQDG